MRTAPIKRVILKKLALPLISLIIATVLALQACVSFVPWRHSSFPSTLRSILSPPTLWPFIDYPMYSGPHFTGDAIARFSLFGILQDSTEVPIIAEDLGLGYWHFRKHFINGLARDDYEEVKVFVELYEKMRQRRLVSVRLEDHPLILAREGVRSAPPKVVKKLRLDFAERQR